MRHAVALAFVLGCSNAPASSGSSSAAPAPSSAAPAQIASTPNAAVSVATSSPPASTGPREATKAERIAAVETLSKFVDAASEKKIALDGGKGILDAKTDPNNLLGRPGQYIEKMIWKTNGHDATIEVFASLDDLQRRREYVEKIGKASPLFLDYVFANEKRLALLRLPKQLTPEETKVWEEMLAAL